VNSKKYGVDLIHFTHAKNTAIHCSTKVDDTIRYLSLHDNKYIRYFPGHTKKVVTLCMSPQDDMFLSGSLDKTIRLWDLRSQNCQGLMHVPSRPVASFDPEGLIFAAGINSEVVKLYDLRSFDKGPFNTFKLEPDTVSASPSAEWTSLRFSPDGKTILIATAGPQLRLLDAFAGATSHVLLPPQSATSVAQRGNTASGGALDCCFSPDSSFVFAASGGDSKIHVWAVETGRHVTALQSDHSPTVQALQFNPKFMMLASACTHMAFWIPNGMEDCT